MTDTLTTLNDVCEFIVDCLHATAPIQDEGYPLIRTPNIGKGRLSLDGAYKVSEDTYETWTRRAVPVTDDLILAREAPAGNVAIVKNGQQVALGQRTVHLRPDKSQVDPDFLCYYLLAPPQQGAFLAGETGATAKHVNMKDIRRLPLKGLPHLNVQQQIGQVLTAYDDLIENNRRRIQLLEQAARLLYKEWFVHLRFPGHEHTHIIDGVPEGWAKATVSNLGQIITGKTPSTKTPENFGGDFPFVKTPDMHRSRIIVETEESLSERGVATQSNKTLPVGTILVACIGAKLGVVSITSRMCQTNQQINAVIPHEDYMRYYSLFALIDMKSRLEAMGGGATMPNVNKTKFSSIPVVIPPPMLIREFDGFTKSMFQQMQLLHEQVSCLTRARDLLLPRLMNGKTAV